MSKTEKVKKPLWKRWWVWLLGIIVIAAAAGGGEEDTVTKEETATETASSKSTEEPKKEEKKQEFTIGQEVKVGKLSYIVKGVEETNKLSSVLGEKTTEGKFAIVEVTVKNGDKKARIIDGEMFRILTADGTEYEPNAELDMYVNEGDIGFFLQEVNPNLSKTGKIVFELPADVTQYDLQVSSGFGWAGGEYETIKLK
jgi:hypothetical protein